MDNDSLELIQSYSKSTFDKWNTTTGAIPDGSSQYYEMKSVIDEIVESTVAFTLLGDDLYCRHYWFKIHKDGNQVENE